jgi:hypothetical protein
MNTQEIKRGEYNAYYPISKLKMASVNRDTVIKHAENFKSKLNEYGWMMPIVVSSKGDVIEGHHRIESAKLLKQKTIPAYVIQWIDTDIEREHLDAIIGLNNSNRNWSKLDYLKAYARYNKNYKFVYNQYLKNQNNLSIGNLINCYFRTPSDFKKGKCIIKDKDFGKYLALNISKLVKKHTAKKIQAYCVRELINVAYKKTEMNKETMSYLFTYYDRMAIKDHKHLTSIVEFRKHIECVLTEYEESK